MQQFADMYGQVQLSKVELEELNRLTDQETIHIREEGGDPVVFESWSLDQLKLRQECMRFTRNSLPSRYGFA